jgi:hypothetical protein
MIRGGPLEAIRLVIGQVDEQMIRKYYDQRTK